MSASPMAAYCQHMFKRFALSVQLYCSTTYKTLITNQHYRHSLRKTSLKLVHYRTLLSMAHHSEACNHNIRVTFHNKTGH